MYYMLLFNFIKIRKINENDLEECSKILDKWVKSIN